ncbi:hypothetical protein RJ53_02320 [Methanocalculus chunghsingensis]|uniref:Uncharacterized protein n=1 Tax=Methanocalculus chunghsingensis TaxID=156457 RepID=A0A8J8B3N3_9EURY|nr:hypothetical protein [Methanocalculus chunghsingensis]MBR1368395.1 hypothetical protein [Methanocalculus chunghsingensis]
MRDSVRRIILFLGTVSIGTFFIFVQLPVIYILLVTFVLGVFLLFLTGALTFSDLRLRRAEAEEKVDEPEVPAGPGWREKFEEKMPSFYRGFQKIEAALAPLGRAAGGVKARFRRSKKEEAPVAAAPTTEKKRLFGGLRDRLARIRAGRQGNSPQTPENPGSDGRTTRSSPRDEAMAAAGAIAASGVTQGSGGSTDDVFGDISLDGLEDDVFAELDGEMGMDGPLLDPDGGEEISVDLDAESGSFMDDAAAILAQEGGLDDEAFDADELSSGMDLDTLELDEDLDALEIDEIDDIDDEPETSSVTTPDSDEEEEEDAEEEQPSTVVAANEGYQFTPDQEQKVPDFGALGGGSDMDILSALKGDVKTIKKELDLSLVRDLRNVDVRADELEDELEMVFKKLGGRREEESAQESER